MEAVGAAASCQFTAYLIGEFRTQFGVEPPDGLGRSTRERKESLPVRLVVVEMAMQSIVADADLAEAGLAQQQLERSGVAEAEHRGALNPRLRQHPCDAVLGVADQRYRLARPPHREHQPATRRRTLRTSARARSGEGT